MNYRPQQLSPTMNWRLSCRSASRHTRRRSDQQRTLQTVGTSATVPIYAALRVSHNASFRLGKRRRCPEPDSRKTLPFPMS